MGVNTPPLPLSGMSRSTIPWLPITTIDVAVDGRSRSRGRKETSIGEGREGRGVVDERSGVRDHSAGCSHDGGLGISGSRAVGSITTTTIDVVGRHVGTFCGTNRREHGAMTTITTITSCEGIKVG